jgi:hypothetical protein
MTALARCLATVVMAATSVAACQKARPLPGAEDGAPAPAPAEADRLRSLGYAAQAKPAAVAPAAPGPAAPGAAAQAPVEAMAAARKLIRTGQLTIEVDGYTRAAEEAGRVAERHGGYVSDARSRRDDRDAQQGTLTLRVPAEAFAAAWAELKALGRVRAETVGTQDVTKAYADLETRLRVKRETVDRLRGILRDRAAKLSDVLEVERELARLTEEIEALEGERRYYDHQVALSTIGLTLQEPQAVVHGGALEPIREAFADALEVLAGSLAALIYVVVAAAPWAVVLWLSWRGVRWLRRRRRSPAAAPEAPVAPAD